MLVGSALEMCTLSVFVCVDLCSLSSQDVESVLFWGCSCGESDDDHSIDGKTIDSLIVQCSRSSQRV